MNISREAKKAEAIKRMNVLKIFDTAIRMFEKDDVVMCSEPTGALFFLDEEQKKLVSEFENENNCLVYLVVRGYTLFGKMDSYLFVSDFDEEWEMDNDDIAELAPIPMTYTYNYDCPDFSEFGHIGVLPLCGGLKRVS